MTAKPFTLKSFAKFLGLCTLAISTFSLDAQAGDFLEQNKQKEGVIETQSGLQYKIIEEGTGRNPTANDTVTVHYRGTLTNGTEFDSSYSGGKPISFPLHGVIKGWTEGLQLIKEGGKIQLFIPSDLAYGNRNVGQHIKAGDTLVFDVELLKIK